ncbi:MAG: hypothetical protein ACYS9C_08800, partial [Planctomycetota bacterium]
MRNTHISAVVLFCFAAVGLAGCSCGPGSLDSQDAHTPAKPGQTMPLRTISAGPDRFRWPEGKRAAI